MNQANLQHFLDYHYIPFSKKQCGQRIVLLWALSLVPVFVGTRRAVWAFVLAVPNIIIGILFVFLILRYPRSRMSRYLCDGVTFLHLAVLLMLSAYRIITYESGKNVLLLLLLAAVLALDLLLFFFLTLQNIAADKYRPDNANSDGVVIPYVFGAVGIVFAGVFLTSQRQKTALTILAVCLMILSLLIGIGSLNLLKAYFFWKNVP